LDITRVFDLLMGKFNKYLVKKMTKVPKMPKVPKIFILKDEFKKFE